MKRRSNSAEASQTCGKAAGRPGRRRREKEGEREGVREGQPTGMLRNAGRPRLAPLRWLRTRKVEASQKPSLVYLDPHNTSRRSEDSTESFGSSDCGGTEEHRAAACLQRAFRGFRARKQAQTGQSTVPPERAQIKAVYRPVMTAQALVAAADCARGVESLEARAAQQPASFYKAQELVSFYKERITSAGTHGTREEDDETLVKKAIRLLRAAASRCLAPTHFDNDDYDDAAPLSAWARGDSPEPVTSPRERP